MNMEEMLFPAVIIVVTLSLLSGISFYLYLNYLTQKAAIENRCEQVISPNSQIIWTNCKGPVTQEIK